MEPCLIQWLHASHGAIWWIPHSPPWDGVRSGTQCCPWSCRASSGCKFIHDNLFTSLGLLDEMTNRRYGSSGTMRQNRLFDVPFKPQKEFMKLSRGTSDVLTQGDKLLVHWRDNNVVTVATNMEEKYSETFVKRWNKDRRTLDKVPQPKCINLYNEHMGGVDLHHQQVSRYHISIRSKKWWWPSLHGLSTVHLWTAIMGGTIDLLTFSRIVAQSLMQKFGTKPLSQGRRSLLAATSGKIWQIISLANQHDASVPEMSSLWQTHYLCMWEMQSTTAHWVLQVNAKRL